MKLSGGPVPLLGRRIGSRVSPGGSRCGSRDIDARPDLYAAHVRAMR